MLSVRTVNTKKYQKHTITWYTIRLLEHAEKIGNPAHLRGTASSILGATGSLEDMAIERTLRWLPPIIAVAPRPKTDDPTSWDRPTQWPCGERVTGYERGREGGREVVPEKWPQPELEAATAPAAAVRSCAELRRTAPNCAELRRDAPRCAELRRAGRSRAWPCVAVRSRAWPRVACRVVPSCADAELW